MNTSTHKICLGTNGLGYVGLPVALTFGKTDSTIGFDIDKTHNQSLQQGHDHTLEVDAGAFVTATQTCFTADVDELAVFNASISTVPTPVDKYTKPDLSFLRHDAKIVGKLFKKGGVGVYETTVYPGYTEKECVPILDRTNGLTVTPDFFGGYHPQVILSGCLVNDDMGLLVTSKRIQALIRLETYQTALYWRLPTSNSINR